MLWLVALQCLQNHTGNYLRLTTTIIQVGVNRTATNSDHHIARLCDHNRNYMRVFISRNENNSRMIELLPPLHDVTVFGNHDDRPTETQMTNPMFDAFDTDSLKVPEVDSTTDENLTASDGASIKSEKVIANYKAEFSQTNPLYTGDHAQ